MKTQDSWSDSGLARSSEVLGGSANGGSPWTFGQAAWFCAGNCGRPVEPVFDGVWPPAACYCTACAEERRVLEASAEWADRLVDARIPPRYQGFDLQRIAPRLTGESDDSFVTRVEGLDRFLGAFIERSHAAMRLRRWLRLSRPRSSLWLMGPSGVGKTLFACVIGEELLRQGENVLFLPETDFFAQLAVEWSGPRPTFGILSEARGCDLLILDGANVAAHQKEPPRPWMSRALFQLVSARTNACRPIVWTSLNTIDAYADVWEGSDPADCQGLGGRIYHACGRTELELPGLNWRMTGRETDSF